MADSNELESFRAAWLAEVKQRTRGESSDGAQPSTSTPATGLATALDAYALAVDYEQRGMLDDALKLYQRAFRSDPNVDRAYGKQQRELQPVGEQLQAMTLTDSSRTSDPLPAEQPIQIVVEALRSEALGFAPLDERLPVPIGVMPNELLVLCLLALALEGNATPIERMALVNRKLRMLTLEPTIWKSLVNVTYVPPQVATLVEAEDLGRRYQFDYRRIFIERPRVRLDGVYISVCHYVRAGLSDNPWYNPTHLITYHRYLRFLADGTVLSLLSNEESAPREVVQTLKASLQVKGLFVGKWRLTDGVVDTYDLLDTSGQQIKYSFAMRLVLKSKPLGRWNKMEFVSYKSVHRKSEEEEALPMRHERAFHFSKVRSYG